MEESRKGNFRKYKEYEKGIQKFFPSNDAPFNSFVKIRNELAHSLDTEELIDINTLVKTIDYMEELLNVLKTHMLKSYSKTE